jgi:lysine biosynthesis protein LysW
MSYEEMAERPVTWCPDCGGEIDLTAADLGDTVTCVTCGAEWQVVSLDPPEVDDLPEEGPEPA